jgi:hypothetical protein
MDAQCLGVDRASRQGTEPARLRNGDGEFDVARYGHRRLNDGMFDMEEVEETVVRPHVAVLT